MYEMMKISVKMLVQLDPSHRHSCGKCPQYVFQSKHKSKNGVLYHRIPSKNGLLKVENKQFIEQFLDHGRFPLGK